MSADLTLAAELRTTFLAQGLTDEQLEQMASAGWEVVFEPGDVVVAEGEPAEFFWVLLSGSVQLARRSGNETIQVATMTTPGQWAGGFHAWDESAGYLATGHALEPARFFEMPSADLARLVDDWFPFGRHMINGFFRTVRTVEATVRQRASLMALGQLSAGLAHEINNPAAAAIRDVEDLGRTCDAMLESIAALAGTATSREGYAQLDTLRRELARQHDTGGAMARMDREDRLGSWLEAHKVERPWDLAAELATTTADEAWLQRVEDAVGTDAISSALRWVSTTVAARSLLDDLTDTTNRISNLVAMMKSYSQMDRSARQRADLRDGIESTLVMLAHKLHGITVQRKYGQVPAFEMFPGELNQVWTNLVDNAIDAMDGAGIITIATRIDGDAAVVEITDTGPGMPAEVIERAFEPFFTTKDIGKGTGLGLDISRRIAVERHGGSIEFDSEPGRTVARVCIPMGD